MTDRAKTGVLNAESAAANYNGNISAIEWRVGANCLVSGVTRNKAAYGFTYDNKNRLPRAVDGATTTEKYYIGSMEYNGANLEAVYYEEGRAVPSGAVFECQYAIRDHLGSSRVMFRWWGARLP